MARGKSEGRPKDAPSVVHLLHRAGQRADEIFARAAVDLTPRQYEILKVVAHEGGPSQTAIMAATGIDRSSTAALVSRMVRNGLLQRRRTRNDTRTYAVRLTARGQHVLQATQPLARTADADLLGCLSTTQKRDFVEALQRIVGLS
jgi:DNA-binding MarR family transcriptional regulator